MIGRQPADEARYIIAGHQLIYELWHGGGSPYYETYFSGRPGHLLAAGGHGRPPRRPAAGAADEPSCSCWPRPACCSSPRRRLFGYWAAVMASGAVRAALGLTHDIGVYASYDALALMLIASAAYCAVAATGRPGGCCVPPLLLAANAVEVHDPRLRPRGRSACAALQVCTSAGGRRAAGSHAGGGDRAVLALAVYLAGTAYVKGIAYTTSTRNSHALDIRRRVPAGAGDRAGDLALDRHRDRARRRFAAAGPAARRETGGTWRSWGFCVFAGFMVTLEALHLHSDESMRQHDDFGAWFAAMAGGYALSLAQETGSPGGTACS